MDTIKFDILLHYYALLCDVGQRVVGGVGQRGNWQPKAKGEPASKQGNVVDTNSSPLKIILVIIVIIVSIFVIVIVIVAVCTHSTWQLKKSATRWDDNYDDNDDDDNGKYEAT